MESGSTVGALSLIALILVNAVISAAHAALVNARKQQLRELADEGNRRAKRALDISEDATRLLASRQFASILLHVAAAGIATVAISQPLITALVAGGMQYNVAQWIVYPATWLIGAMTMLLFGELIPIAFAAAQPERLAILSVGPMTLFLALLSPLTRLMIWFSNRVVSPLGGRENAPYVTEEEIKTLVDAGSEEGSIEDEEKAMIYSIFQFGDKVAREVMVPRIDIVAVDLNTPLHQALDIVLAEGHSRIPVYEGTIDRIAGLLYAKDLLPLLREGQNKDKPVREIMRPAYFVPESKKAGDLLEELQERKIHMAIVIDEYGGTAGLVTIEDLLEEIVGEIQDEYDPDEEAAYEKFSDDEVLFDAGINLANVNELLDVSLPTDESDTLGGYVLTVLGKVPLAGETIRTKNLEIKVESITGRRIRKVRVRRLPPDETQLTAAETEEQKTSSQEKTSEKLAEKPTDEDGVGEPRLSSN